MANNCQVPTPLKYVDELLDYVGYTQDLYEKSILENSCGEGNILKEVVKRYIINSREDGYNDKQIIDGLERDITGYDTDPICVRKCIKNLDLIALEYGLVGINWNIRVQDYLKCQRNSYQYVIGNPPYITYHDLTMEQREFLKKNFETCKDGRFDYCYAFIEAGLRDLADDGRLAYIIPYSVIRNKFAENTRELIKDNLRGIIDYKGIQLFPNTVTSSVVIFCDKQKRISISYCNKKTNITKNIDKNNLSKKWMFEEEQAGYYRFGDYFKVSNSVATLYNKAFVFEAKKMDKQFYYLADGKIEKEIVFDAASPKSEKKYQNNKKKRDKIIFPYKRNKGNTVCFEEKEFKQLFPECYAYLERKKEKLLERKSSEGVKWFEYGRVQGINSIFVDKLILSNVITNNVKVYAVANEAIPYAGVYIRVLPGSRMSLNEAKEILQSDAFYSYVMNCGTPTTTSSYRISVKDIENYYF